VFCAICSSVNSGFSPAGDTHFAFGISFTQDAKGAGGQNKLFTESQINPIPAKFPLNGVPPS